MKTKSALIIDDNETDRYLLKRDLKIINFSEEIFEADNGQEALDFLKNYDINKLKFKNTFPPIIVFVDINMPLLNGFEFLNYFEDLRNLQEDYKSIIFMMFTTSEKNEDKVKAMSYKFVKNYLIKGRYNLDTLKNVVLN